MHKEMTEKELDDAAKARRKRIEYILNHCAKDGYKARNRGQMKPMNPFSADTEPHQHKAWLTGWEQRDGESQTKGPELDQQRKEKP